jgi:hypothetical protein
MYKPKSNPQLILRPQDVVALLRLSIKDQAAPTYAVGHGARCCFLSFVPHGARGSLTQFRTLRSLGTGRLHSWQQYPLAGPCHCGTRQKMVDLESTLNPNDPNVRIYHDIEKDLRLLGFTEDLREGAPICWWRVAGVTLDVMPTDKSILGFSNEWYPLAIASATFVRSTFSSLSLLSLWKLRTRFKARRPRCIKQPILSTQQRTFYLQ